MAGSVSAREARGMEPWSALGKTLVLAGFSLAALGALLWLGPQLPGLGRLPGDVHIERPGFSLQLPLGSSLLVSIVLSAALYVFTRLR